MTDERIEKYELDTITEARAAIAQACRAEQAALNAVITLLSRKYQLLPGDTIQADGAILRKERPE